MQEEANFHCEQQSNLPYTVSTSEPSLMYTSFPKLVGLQS
jgi:hypothetical protein